MEFSERLQKSMNRQTVTMYKLAKAINVHQSTIKNWISGKSKPGLDALMKISSTLDCDVDYLLGRQEEFKKNIDYDVTTINSAETQEKNENLFAFENYLQHIGVIGQDEIEWHEYTKRTRYIPDKETGTLQEDSYHIGYKNLEHIMILPDRKEITINDIEYENLRNEFEFLIKEFDKIKSNFDESIKKFILFRLEGYSNGKT